ncbi:MAG: hypothetical protein JWL59_132 [Chthoniobacteraceae bacterium]|nr:hypothetical protein [Chthoniobacteraceae bacterium]
MNKRQLDKISSYQTLRLVLEDAAYKALWTPLPAFAKGVAAFYGSLNLLTALTQAQGTMLTGVTVDKERLAESVINRTLLVAGALAAYASASGNRTLFDKSDIRLGDLQKLRDAALDDAAFALYSLAAAEFKASPATLAEYGMSAAQLKELSNAIAAYSAMVGKPFAERAKRKSATDAIPDELARIDQVLSEQIDRLMPQFAGNKEFAAAYENARQIVHSGGSGKAKVQRAPLPALAAGRE